MPEKTVRVTLDVTVRDLTQEELDNQGIDPTEFLGDEEEPSSYIDETYPRELAEIVAGMFHSDAITEAFAGTNLCVTFEERPVVIAAEWS